MKKYLILAAIAIASLALSYIMIPGEREISAMKLRDKEYSSALEAYNKRLDKGEMDIEIASALTDLHLKYGDIDEAISVMERYLEKNPGNLSARKQLGQLYQFAQRPDDYAANLEKINEITRSPEALNEMNTLYAASQQYDKQEPTLKALVGDENEREPQHYRNLARIQAEKHDFASAAQTYSDFSDAYPQIFTFDDLEAMLSYYLDAGSQTIALQKAKDYAQRNPSTREIARIANILHYRGNTELADDYLGVYESELMSDTHITIEKANILLAQGNQTEIFDVLAWLDENEALTPALKYSYVVSLIQREKYDAAYKLLETLDYTMLSDAQLVYFYELALAQKQSEIAHIVAVEAKRSGRVDSAIFDYATAIALQQKTPVSLEDAIQADGVKVEDKTQLANLCYLAGEKACVRMTLQHVANDSLTIDQSINVAELMFAVGMVNDAEEMIAPLYVQLPQRRDIAMLKARIFIAKNDELGLERWFTAQDRLERDELEDLYYTAQNYKRIARALEMAERLHQQYADADSENLLLDAYLASGNFAKALPYLRDRKDNSAEAKEDYLYALTRLVKKDQRHGEELVRFARQEINNPALSEKQKKAFVYALLDAGRPEVVLPFIAELAHNRGGEWAQIYADNLDRLGRHEEARKFRLQLAYAPNASEKLQTEMAFALLDNGYKQDAENIFLTLAENAPVDSPEVQQLLYLWGARPDQGKIDWLLTRYMVEEDADAQQLWADYLVDRVSDEGLVALIDREPLLGLQSQDITARYYEALHRQGRFKDYAEREVQNDLLLPHQLRQLARAADDQGYEEIGARAYRRLNDVIGADPESMRNLGLHAFSRADYSEVINQLIPYVEYQEENSFYHEDDYKVYYYLAEALKVTGEAEEANYYYGRVLQATDYTDESPDMQARRAQSFIGRGDTKSAVELFEAAKRSYPDDRLLNADYVSSMIEVKEYQKAVHLMMNAPEAESLEGQIYELPLPTLATERYHVDVYGNEAVLNFDTAVPEPFAFDHLSSTDDHPWLSYTNGSHAQFLIVAKPEYELEIRQTDTGYSLFAIAKPSEIQKQLNDELDVRYAMLEARVGLETGDHYQATQDLIVMAEEHPNDATLLGYTANALNFTGNPKKALRILEQANALMPENEDIQRLQRDIKLEYAQHVKVDYDWLKIGDSNEEIWSLSGVAYVDDELEVGGNIQTVDIEAENVRRIDGRTGDFETTKQRGEIYVAHQDDDGQRVQASIYANNEDIGLGISYQWLHLMGKSRLYGEYHRPNWEFVEGILDDATRDRIGFQHSYILNPLWNFQGDVAYNRYNLEDEEGVADSVSFLFSATRRLREAKPYLAANYTLDSEYRVGEKDYLGVAGDRFFPLLDSREVHTLTLIAAEQFTENTDGLIQAGYSYDRLGGNGPLISGRMNHQMFDDALEAQIRASYGARTSDSEGDTARIGGHLKWRF